MNENDKQYTELGRLYAEWYELNKQRKAAKKWRNETYARDMDEALYRGYQSEENKQAHSEYIKLSYLCAIAKRAVTRLAKKVVTP